MTRYFRTTKASGFQIVWDELRHGARATNQRDMPMTAEDVYAFKGMLRREHAELDQK